MQPGTGCGVLLSLVLGLCVAPGGTQNIPESIESGGYRLPQNAGYLLVSPKKIRPDQDFRLFVTIYKMYHHEVDVRAMISRDAVEYATSTVTFTDTGTKEMLLKIPYDIRPGEHRLLVEGLANTASGDILFTNETALEFETKYISVFIRTDHFEYYPENTVRFRVLAVTPDLMPVNGALTVNVIDAGGATVRRWLAQQFNFGVFSASFKLDYPVKDGNWTIRVFAFGHIYEDYFGMYLFYPRRIEVNVTMPLYITDQEWGLAGTIYAEHTFPLVPGKGNATVELRVMDLATEALTEERIVRHINHMSHEIPIAWSFDEIKEVFGEVTGKGLWVKAWFYDWILTETQNSTALTRVIPDQVNVRIIGRAVRTFKPRAPFYIHFAVMKSDGSPYTEPYFRTLVVEHTHIGGSTHSYQDKLIIPDDGIVKAKIRPDQGDHKIHVRAYHESGSMQIVEVNCFQAFSPKGHYLYLTTVTDHPSVDSYMIFTVRTNVYVDEITYLIMGHGTIIAGATLSMAATQKTFSVAVSRQMAPVARLVTYFIHEGEVVADAISFHVSYSRLRTANLTLNKGKDFTEDTLELITRGPPGSFSVIEGSEYEFWRRGAKTFLTEELIEDDLRTYDAPAMGPYHHIWYYRDDRWESDVFFNAPTPGMDALQTFQMAGLDIFGDMNFTYFVENDPCNVTIGLGRCPHTGECYEKFRECDGFFDCADGYDETACQEESPAVRRPMDIKYLQRQIRFYNDMNWLWKPGYIMPYGSSERTLSVPETKDPYVISGFVLSPQEGLLLVDDVVMHDCTRKFFMLMNIPAETRRGEQLGVELTLFNFHDERIEIIVMLHGSEDYKFVIVEEFGIVSSYAPRTVFGDVQTMVVLESGEQRYLYMPVLPLVEEGELIIKITAFSILDIDTEERVLSTRYDGVLNDDHTPYLVDLVNHGSVMIPDFDSVVPEQFIDPDIPYHRYVKGSEWARMTIFGDLWAPDFEYGEFLSFPMMGIPHDTGEGYLFEYHFNLQHMYFLRETNALVAEQEEYILDYLNRILMRQYAYMYQITDEDGDDVAFFKQYRRVNEPSLWVTSIGLRALHFTLDTFWAELLYVPKQTVNRLALWLCKKQHKDGYWVEESVIYDRNMKPFTNATDGGLYEWNIPLTTHITITLAKLKHVSGDAKEAVSAALLKAQDYLNMKWERVNDPVQMCMIAYSFNLVGHYAKDAIFLRAHAMRREDNHVYWANFYIEPNLFHVIDTIVIMEPKLDYINLGEAAIATSYMLMMYLERMSEPWLSFARSSMNFLNDQRIMMFALQSTMDTLIGYEALSRYALNEKNRFIYTMEITIESTFVPGWNATINFNPETWMKMHYITIPDARGQVKARAKGTGYAVMMYDVEHNVEYPQLENRPFYESFGIEMEEVWFTGRNSSMMYGKVCTWWVRPDLSEIGGQSFIMMEIPTGFYINRDTIMNMYYEQDVPGLRRIRFRNKWLFLIYEYLLQERTCVTFRADRWYPVANASIQYLMGTFEYSEAGLQQINLYNTYQLFHQHLCQVCASYQCPYCPYYNDAPSIITPLSCLVVLLTTALGFYIRKCLLRTVSVEKQYFDR